MSDGMSTPPHAGKANSMPVKHVRRPARTFGPSTARSESPLARVADLFSGSASGAKHTRSQSTQLSAAPDSAAQTRPRRLSEAVGSSPRRSTVSNGSLPQQGLLARGTAEPNGRSRRTSSASSTGAGETAALNCPICGVMAPSLFALNVHLDDTHFAGDGGGSSNGSNSTQRTQESSSAAQGGQIKSRYASQDDLDEVKGAILGFFRGAGRAVKGLSGTPTQESPSSNTSDIGDDRSPPLVVADQGSGSQGRWRAGQSDGADRGQVTKAHWQQYRSGDRCNVPACTLALTSQTGHANCRKCGRLMCSQHCSHRLDLSSTAQPSARGYACRVCEECYQRATQSQTGPSRSHTATFVHLRRKVVTAALLEGNRMEKRLEKLSLVYLAADAGNTSSSSSLLRSKSLQTAEQSVVVWESDAHVESCPLCQKSFGRLASRRHHCRLCGRVICGRSSCLTQLSIPLASPDGSGFSQEQFANVKACRDCEHIVLRHRDRTARATQAPTVLGQLYARLGQCMEQVEEVLPTFNALALRLGGGGGTTSSPDLPRAARIRRQLTASFNDLDKVSKRIAQLPAPTATDQRLHMAIRRSVAQYLQLHMFPLTMLPKPDHSKGTKADRTPRAPTPLRQSTSAAEVSEDGEGAQSKDTLAAVPPSISPSPSMPSSISTLNIDAEAPQPAKGPGVSAKSIVSNVSSVGGAVVGGTLTGITSLLSYVAPGAAKQSKKATGGLLSQDELIAQALSKEPEREQRVVEMGHEEKLSTLS
ncbi:carboxypeptidase Y-deficient, partial [Linderina macrospora]